MNNDVNRALACGLALAAALMVGWAPTASQAQPQNRLPLNRAFLQTHLDGNQKDGTNFGRVVATNFVGNGAGLTNIPVAGLAQSGATNGQAIVWNGSQWAPGSGSGGGFDWTNVWQYGSENLTNAPAVNKLTIGATGTNVLSDNGSVINNVGITNRLVWFSPTEYIGRTVVGYALVSGDNVLLYGTSFFTVHQPHFAVAISNVIRGNYSLLSNVGFTNGTVGCTGLILKTPTVPANTGDTGIAGQIAWDSDYLYICVAANTWKRIALSSW